MRTSAFVRIPSDPCLKSPKAFVLSRSQMLPGSSHRPPLPHFQCYAFAGQQVHTAHLWNAKKPNKRNPTSGKSVVSRDRTRPGIKLRANPASFAKFRELQPRGSVWVEGLEGFCFSRLACQSCSLVGDAELHGQLLPGRLGGTLSRDRFKATRYFRNAQACARGNNSG